MKIKVLLILTGCVTNTALAQGTFVNLNFEATTLPYSSNAVGNVSASDAFPGWTVRYGDSLQPVVPYNLVTLAPVGALLSRDFGVPPAIPASFGLFAPHFNPSLSVNVSLSQSGTIPVGMNSILFETFGFFNPDLLQISFGGNLLPLNLVPGGTVLHNSWIADLSGLEGQNGELRVTVLGQGGRLDNLQFAAVPEPSTWALLALGGVLLAWTMRRRKV